MIVSNTSIDKDILEGCSHEGGISGKPLLKKSNQLLKRIHGLDKDIFLVGVGGVSTKEDYENKITLGASLVQIYTGFIFEGPAIVKKSYLDEYLHHHWLGDTIFSGLSKFSNSY